MLERTDYDGSISTPLDSGSLDEAVKKIIELNVASVAISLIHSYANPSHEDVIRDTILRRAPQLSVSVSSEISPKLREYERTNTAVANAYVQPILDRYIARLESALAKKGFKNDLFIMQSNGGLVSPKIARHYPIRVVESGPAAGVLMGGVGGERVGEKHIITFDMGGTTAKASLIQDGIIETTPEYEVGGEGSGSRWLHGTGHPIRVPVIDLAEVSAGGGSIAWVDPAGSLRVGPKSAGAVPGPVCYDRGGSEPSVTDANLILGRLDSTTLLGGDLLIDFSKAEQAIKEKIADPLNVSIEQAASSIIQIVNNSMSEALRIVSVERGHDAREFALICFGGAGPLHAAALAEELQIKEVIVPPIPGAFSALGLIGSDISRDYGKTFFSILDETEPNTLEASYLELEKSAREMLSKTNVPEENWILRRSMDVRYVRQAYELNVDVSNPITSQNFSALPELFHEKHATTYGHANKEERIQIVTLRLSAKAKLPELKIRQSTKTDLADTTKKRFREVWVEKTGKITTAVFDRANIQLGTTIEGPAIVESLESTLVIPPDWTALMDTNGFIILSFARVT